MFPDKDGYWDQWEKLLEVAAAIQGLLPGAVLIGGSAASIHVKHRFSFDAGHILSDLEKNYEKVLDFLEAWDDWETVWPIVYSEGIPMVLDPLSITSMQEANMFCGRRSRT